MLGPVPHSSSIWMASNIADIVEGLYKLHDFDRKEKLEIEQMASSVFQGKP